AGRGDRELDGQTTGLPHATLDEVGDRAEVRVAGRQFRVGVADADDGPAIEDVFGQTHVAHPAAVDEPVLVVLAEPGGRPVGSSGAGVVAVTHGNRILSVHAGHQAGSF